MQPYFCNPCVHAWPDEKFKHADREAFQLTQDTKVYYDDDGVFTCPVCSTLYTLNGNDLTLRNVVGKLYVGKECGDDRRPTIYITYSHDLKPLLPPRHADLTASLIMNNVINEHNFEHSIMDSGSHIYIVHAAVVDWLPDGKPLLLKDAHKYI